MNVFKDLSTSLARFVYAWLVPSATAIAAFVVVVLPDLQRVAGEHVLGVGTGTLGAAILFSLAVLMLSVLFAYTSLPLYRLLEGYTMPRRLQRVLLRRRLREWYRLRALVDSGVGSHAERGLLLESRAAYPDSPTLVMPTRLGNAMRAMERYGLERFGLHSQIFWYELQSVAPDNLRRDTEDARAGVDFFISAIAHLLLLGTVATTVATLTAAAAPSFGWASAVLGLVSFLLVPIAYDRAVRNVMEWRLTVRALVNTGRTKLAVALGVRLPDSFAEERRLWTRYGRLVVSGGSAQSVGALDKYRRGDDGITTDESETPGVTSA